MNQNENYIAIDIAKKSLQVQATDCAKSFTNSLRGFDALYKLIQKQADRTPVVFEATGGYERALMDYLHEKKVPICCINPARIRAFARSHGVKAKTDPIDAKMILRFAQERRPALTKPLQPNIKEMGRLLDRREQVTEMISRERTRLKDGNTTMDSLIKETIDFLEKQIKLLEERIHEIIKLDESLQRKAKTIKSVVGVGNITTWSICAYLPEITQVSREQLVALVGLAPYNKDSGNQQGPRHIQGGRQKVRDPLFMAATSAANHNEVIKAYVDRLKNDKGKHHKSAMVAAMRKIIIHIQSLLKKQENALA